MSNLVPLTNDIQFENDFGHGPIALGRFVETPTELAISYGIAGFVGFVIGGWPVLLYGAFLAANDMKWAGDRQKQSIKDWKASQTAELSKLLGEDAPEDSPAQAQAITAAAAAAPATTSAPPLAMPTPGFIAQMGHNIKAALIVGIPGSGKGLTTANLIDEVRKRRPELSIACLDPKNSVKEAGYFTNRYDHLQRFKMNPRDIDSTIAEVRKFMNAVDQMGDDTLAVIDEAATLFDTLKLEKDFYAVFIRWLALIVQQGNSEGKYVWLLSQTGNLSELGIPPSLRSSLDLLAIAPSGSDAMLQGLLRTDLIPQGRQSSIQTARAAIERSEVERAYYFSREGQWQPMPTLPNPSGYNRDKRSWVPGHLPAEPPSEATDFPVEAIDRMAGQGFAADEVQPAKVEPIDPVLDFLADNPDCEHKDALIAAYIWYKNRTSNSRSTELADFAKRARADRKNDYLRANFEEVWADFVYILEACQES